MNSRQQTQEEERAVISRRPLLPLSALRTSRFSAGFSCVVGSRIESSSAGITADITAGEGVTVFADILSETIGGAR